PRGRREVLGVREVAPERGRDARDPRAAPSALKRLPLASTLARADSCTSGRLHHGILMQRRLLATMLVLGALLGSAAWAAADDGGRRDGRFLRGLELREDGGGKVLLHNDK